MEYLGVMVVGVCSVFFNYNIVFLVIRTFIVLFFNQLSFFEQGPLTEILAFDLNV